MRGMSVAGQDGRRLAGGPAKPCRDGLLRKLPLPCPAAEEPQLAPRHYVDGAEGLFQPHTEGEQARIMAEHCARYETDTIVCYCHYCLEGLLCGGKDGRHLAELLFG